MTGPIEFLFGNYSKVWSDNFGTKAQRTNLFIRGFIFLLPIFFYGALAFIASSEVLHSPAENCNVDPSENINAKSGCQTANTYFLPGALRNNLPNTQGPVPVNNGLILKNMVAQQSSKLQYYNKYFKYSMLVFATFAILSTIGGSLWNWMEDNIVEKYTFEFNIYILTQPQEKLNNQKDKKKSVKQAKIDLFVNFFLNNKCTNNLFLKYLIASVINTLLHFIIFLFFGWLLFEEITHIVDPKEYYNLVSNALKDDLSQQRTDTLATMFPLLYSCQIPFSGPSGSVFNATVTCCSSSNPKLAILHVTAIFFSMFVVIAFIVDTIMLFISMMLFPTAYASQGEIKLKLKQISMSKRLMFILFKKNTETLVWNDFFLIFAEKLQFNNDGMVTSKNERLIQKDLLPTQYETVTVYK